MDDGEQGDMSDTGSDAEAAGFTSFGDMGDDGSTQAGTGDPNNCIHAGKEYSPGDQICGADGYVLQCHNGRWEGTGLRCAPANSESFSMLDGGTDGNGQGEAVV